jgi:hypothetical protein
VVQRPWQGIEHPPPSSTEVKQVYSYTSTPPLGLYDLLNGELPLYYFSQYNEPLLRYLHVNDTRHYKVLWSISSYKPPTGLVLPMTYANPSYFTLVWVHRPGLWGHQISCPLTISCGGTRTWATGKNQRQENNCSSKSACWLHKRKLHN